MKKTLLMILIFLIFLTGCNLPIYSCLIGCHEFEEGKIKEEKENSTIIEYKCKNCIESYEIITQGNKLFFEDVWFFEDEIDFMILSNVEFNESVNLINYQEKYFNDLLHKMRNCELNYFNKRCNCTPLFEVSTKNKSVIFSFHKDHLVLKTKSQTCLGSQVDDYYKYCYLVQESTNFKLEMFNEIFKWISVDSKIINKEYDYISDYDLEYLSKNCNGMNFNIGFGELIAPKGGILNSSLSFDQFVERVSNFYNPEFYKDIEIANILETDYYYCAVTNYVYISNNKAGQRYLISFKTNVFDIETDTMLIREKNNIKLILDTIFYYLNGRAITHSEIIEEQDCYLYVKYEVFTTIIDMERIKEAQFIRTIYRIDKSSSIIEKESVQTINCISYKY